MIPFIDIHTHQTRLADDLISIRNFAQNEWENAFYTEGGYCASVGLHPWFLSAENFKSDFQKLSQLIENQNILAIGECGLDRLRGGDLAFQIKTFELQIQLAERVGKPVIIHCVRAFNDILEVKKRLKPTVPMIIHGFNKNEQIRDSLLKNGFYISIGASILRGQNEKSPSARFLKMILEIPPNRLFFETDTQDLPVQDIYSAFAKAKSMDLAELKSMIYENFKTVFYINQYPSTSPAYRIWF